MSTEALKTMKEQLMSCVQGQLGDLAKVDAEQLGEAIDMIKDLSEAIYYCTITQSMEKGEEEKKWQGSTNINYYTTPYYKYPPDYREMERQSGYMYYTGTGGAGTNGQTGTGISGNRGGMNYYTEMPNSLWRDPREGRSPMRRRMYMEGKEMHNDTNSQLRELEAYLQELSTDITEMIKDASPEERATLHQKMTTLASKIV